jgi:hypothetical protein
MRMKATQITVDAVPYLLFVQTSSDARHLHAESTLQEPPTTETAGAPPPFHECGTPIAEPIVRLSFPRDENWSQLLRSKHYEQLAAAEELLE